MGSGTSPAATSGTAATCNTKVSPIETVAKTWAAPARLRSIAAFVWSVKHDNRIAQNDETRGIKGTHLSMRLTMKSRPIFRLDIANNLSGAAKGDNRGVLVEAFRQSVDTSIHAGVIDIPIRQEKDRARHRYVDAALLPRTRILPTRTTRMRAVSVIGRTLVEEGSDLADRLPGRHGSHNHADHAVGYLGRSDQAEHLRLGPGTTVCCRRASTRTNWSFLRLASLIDFMEGDLVSAVSVVRRDLRKKLSQRDQEWSRVAEE